MTRRLFLLISSFVIVAWGQPDNGLFFCLLASSCGFALFWQFLLFYSKKKTRFWVGSLWFTSVQLVQLSWLAQTEYQGFYILFVYAALSFLLGLEFGLFCLLFPKKPPLAYTHLLTLASVWTLIEWGRLHVLCGFAWNPIGLSMTAHCTSSQMIALLGVYGLSFWTAWVNLLFLSALTNRSWKRACVGSAAYLFPFVFGVFHIMYHDSQNQAAICRVALVQTALLPDEKNNLNPSANRFVPPAEQWISMIHYLDREKSSLLDLIVMPECAVPLSAHACVYPYEEVKQVLQTAWGAHDWSYLLDSPLAEKKDQWYVNNLFWAQVFADHYNAKLVVGLMDWDAEKKESYNAAFHLLPHLKKIDRYEKRVLLPLAEYLPFSFLRPLSSQYGISNFFTHGTEAKIFQGALPIGISICYEECFGRLIRESKQKGAQLLINLTNDAWYPFSGLHLKHYFHGKLRAIENGLPLLRACNTGVTAAIDSLGRTRGQFAPRDLEIKKGALIVEMNCYTYPTLYSVFGDFPIIFFCLFSIGLCIVLRRIDRSPARRIAKESPLS